MIEVFYPGCQKRISAPDKYAGKAVRCPACQAAMRIPEATSEPVLEPGAAPAPAPEQPAEPESTAPAVRKPRAGARPVRPRSRPTGKREKPGRSAPAEPDGPGIGRRLLKSSTLRWGLLLVGIIAAMFVFFWWQDKSFWEYAEKRISAEVADPEARAVALVVARACHGRAMSEAAPRDLRGRKRLDAVSKPQYFEVLLRLTTEELKGLDGQGPPDRRTIAEFWTRRDYANDQIYAVHLKDDGTYRQAVYDIIDDGLERPLAQDSGTWQLKDNVLTWRYDGRDDPNPVVRWGRNAFILKETDGSYTYWLNAGSSARLRELLK